MHRLVLIDGHSLAYRMYFALENTRMKTSQNEPTWAVYGFFRALFDVIKSIQPEGLAVAFDMSRETFRNQLFPEYKANRQSMPDDMPAQMDWIRKGIESLDIPILEMPDFEADDVIGTLARQAAAQGVEVVILTGDQDAFQVIDLDNRISLLLPSFKGGLTKYDRQKVYEKWGIWPEQVTDFKGLKGDTSDNIPGVPGVGDKTAAKLLTEYETLENVLAHIEEVSGKKLKESLETYKDQAVLSKQLATIRYDVPVRFDDEACRLRVRHADNFIAFLQTMEFRSLLSQAPTLLAPFENGNGQGNGHSAIVPAITNTEKPQLGNHREAYRCIASMEELKQFLTKANQTHVITLDIETTGLDVFTSSLAGIALAWTPRFKQTQRIPRNVLALKTYPTQTVFLEDIGLMDAELEVVYVPLQHPEADRCLSWNQVKPLITEFLGNPANAVIMHNAKFELNTFRQLGVPIEASLIDTMLVSFAVNPDRRHGLKQLAIDILNEPIAEITELIGKGKKQIPFTEVPLDKAYPYACDDAYSTAQLMLAFIPQLSSELISLLTELEFPLIRVLAEMEFNGISVDTNYLLNLSEKLDTQLQAIEQAIYELAGCEFNLNSPKQVSDVFFVKLQIPAQGKTASKTDFSTNAKVLETLAPDYPIVQKLLDYRQLFKLKSTYVDVLPELVHPDTHRLHASFNQTVAVTGRLSSSDPNMQNIPIRSAIGRQIRHGFVPRDRNDAVILSADYSQIELRLLAHFSEDPNLVEAFCQGEDIHKATAALVFEVPLDKVTKEMRYRAKAVNFGIIYGQTAYGLSKTLDIPPKEAQWFIDRYFSRYPKVKTFITDTIAQAHETGTVSTLFGRVRQLSEGLSSRQKFIREYAERAAFNTPLQGSAADIMKLAMCRILPEIPKEGRQSKLILQVHDELVLEVPKAEVADMTTLVKWAMELEQPLRVPLVVDVSTGPTWMEADE